MSMGYVVANSTHASATVTTATALGAVTSYVACVVLESSIHPFDVLEAEPELVSGWYVDYGGVVFMVIYLGEGIAITASD